MTALSGWELDSGDEGKEGEHEDKSSDADFVNKVKGALADAKTFEDRKSITETELGMWMDNVKNNELLVDPQAAKPLQEALVALLDLAKYTGKYSKLKVKSLCPSDPLFSKFFIADLDYFNMLDALVYRGYKSEVGRKWAKMVLGKEAIWSFCSFGAMYVLKLSGSTSRKQAIRQVMVRVLKPPQMIAGVMVYAKRKDPASYVRKTIQDILGEPSYNFFGSGKEAQGSKNPFFALTVPRILISFQDVSYKAPFVTGTWRNQKQFDCGLFPGIPTVLNGIMSGYFSLHALILSSKMLNNAIKKNNPNQSDEPSWSIFVSGLENSLFEKPMSGGDPYLDLYERYAYEWFSCHQDRFAVAHQIVLSVPQLSAIMSAQGPLNSAPAFSSSVSVDAINLAAADSKFLDAISLHSAGWRRVSEDLAKLMKKAKRKLDAPVFKSVTNSGGFEAQYKNEEPGSVNSVISSLAQSKSNYGL